MSEAQQDEPGQKAAPRTGCAWWSILAMTAVGVVVAFAISAVISDSPAIRWLVVLTLMLGVPFGVVLGTTGLFFRGPSGRTIRSIGLGLALASLVQCFPLGTYTTERQRTIDDAKAYCEALAERIDAVIETTGEPPADISELIDETGSPPEAIIRNDLYAVTDDGGYQLSFAVSGAIMFADYYYYDGATGAWKHLD